MLYAVRHHCCDVASGARWLVLQSPYEELLFMYNAELGRIVVEVVPMPLTCAGG